MPATITRERILDEAMHLFSEQGFKATTIVQIEAASGLTPGAGGLYHHFASKEALLRAGIERHLQRLDALRDIREIFAGVGDLRTELTLAARYILAELDRESELMRILAAEARNRPELMAEATERFLGSALRGFATWLAEHSERRLSSADAEALASLSLGGLISTRLLKSAFAMSTTIDDELLVGAWVRLLEPAMRE